MHWEPDVGFNPGSPGSCPGPKAGAKPLCHPGIPLDRLLEDIVFFRWQFLRGQKGDYTSPAERHSNQVTHLLSVYKKESILLEDWEKYR